MRIPRLCWVLVPSVFWACVRAPEIVVVDRATALEQQASGSFEDLERELDRAAFAPVPISLTPDQLEILGLRAPAMVNNSEQTDADRVDTLLRQHCLGEGHDGLLVDTHDDCKGAASPTLVVALVERANQARSQLWGWMHAQRPGVPLATLREGWTRAHAKGVVCGGWVEGEGQKWAGKKC